MDSVSKAALISSMVTLPRFGWLMAELRSPRCSFKNFKPLRYTRLLANHLTNSTRILFLALFAAQIPAVGDMERMASVGAAVHGFARSMKPSISCFHVHARRLRAASRALAHSHLEMRQSSLVPSEPFGLIFGLIVSVTLAVEIFDFQSSNSFTLLSTTAKTVSDY